MAGGFPIGLQYTEVAACGRDRGFTGTGLDEFIELIYAMDAAYLKDAASKSSKPK